MTTLVRDTKSAKPQPREPEAYTVRPAQTPPAPPPATMSQPVATAMGTYLLPASVRQLDLAGLTPRQQDTACPKCKCPLYAAIPVVRLAAGYRDGQQRGTLLLCLNCGEALNGAEIREW